jgi:hypothetical protein
MDGVHFKMLGSLYSLDDTQRHAEGNMPLGMERDHRSCEQALLSQKALPTAYMEFHMENKVFHHMRSCQKEAVKIFSYGKNQIPLHGKVL